MKAVRTLFLAVITTIGFSFITADAQSFVSPKSGRSMDEQVYRKLKGLSDANVFDHITWRISGDTVTLSGKVITLGTKRRAASLVEDIPGVRNVINNIQDLPPSPYDDRIRLAALEELVERGPAQYFSHINPQVRIIVEHGRITLEGFVSSRSHSDTLNILANGIPGVFEVTNHLVVGERKF